MELEKVSSILDSKLLETTAHSDYCNVLSPQHLLELTSNAQAPERVKVPPQTRLSPLSPQTTAAAQFDFASHLNTICSIL